MNIHPTAIISHQPVQVPIFGRLTCEQPAAVLGRDVTVDAHAVIFAGVEIGDDTFVGLRATIREGCRIGKRCMIGADVFFNYDVVCGDDVRMIQGIHVGGLATIGNSVFIGPGVQMSNVKHIDARVQQFIESEAAPITIHDYVVIGAGAIILAGVTIGENAVIGSGAVVTRDVAPSETVVGNPGRPLVRK